MWKSVFVAAVAAAPVIVSAQVVPVGDLALVQKHLQAVQTMTALFSQTDRNGKVLTGTITLKRPGKVRFQYQPGVPILIVGDGSALWFLDYSVGQKQRWPIGNSPLGVLLDPSRDISRYARVTQSYDPRVISVEANDTRHPEYGKITLVFRRDASGPAGLMLEGWVALDAQNNRTTIRLSNQQFNQPVAERMFLFNDPKKSSGRG